MKSAEFLTNLQSEMEDVFSHLHANPEVSWKESQTTSFLARQLEDIGLRVTTFAAFTGVIGEWGPLIAPVVALRADIDALWQEVDGVWRANHSCGHDAHMTMVLGAIKWIHHFMPDPEVRIRVLFQPAEEMGEGAQRFAEYGALEDVAYLFGIHVRPIQELHVGKMAAAIYNGASTEIRGKITGISAHGARPHLGVNAIEVAFSILQAIQSIHMDPMVPHSVKMTQIKAGGENANIIPDSALFAIDVRAQTNALMDNLLEQVEERITAIAKMYQAKAQLTRTGQTIAAEVSREAQKIMASSIVEEMGSEALADDIITAGAEDFHYYSVMNPNLKATMLGVGCGVSPGLHHPYMTFEHRFLIDGAKILANAVMKAIEQLKN